MAEEEAEYARKAKIPPKDFSRHWLVRLEIEEFVLV